jgi:hypothetical protein
VHLTSLKKRAEMQSDRPEHRHGGSPLARLRCFAVYEVDLLSCTAGHADVSASPNLLSCNRDGAGLRNFFFAAMALWLYIAYTS